jgi:hypothetical protein
MNTPSNTNEKHMNDVRKERPMNDDERQWEAADMARAEAGDAESMDRTDHEPNSEPLGRSEDVYDATQDAELVDRPTLDYEPGDAHSSYLDDQAARRAAARWQEIQSEFVDDPRRTVASAHELVGELVQSIIDRFTRERAELERQWSRGGEVSTEDLRVCLQRYRAFFNQLLPQAVQRPMTDGTSAEMHR